MFDNPKECSKCSDNVALAPCLPGFFICGKCGTLYRDGEFGTPEEVTEFDLSLLGEEVQETLSKFQKLMRGEAKINIDLKDIGKAGEALGIVLADMLANFRNAVCARAIVNPQALDNVLVQGLIMQLSVAIAQMVRRREDPDKLFGERTTILRSVFNRALGGFVERFVPNSVIISLDNDGAQKEDGKDDESGTG